MATKIIANPKATGEKEERITPKDVEDIKIQLDTLRSLLASRISATSQVQVNPVKDLDSVLRSLPAGKRIVTLAERHIGERVVFGARAVMTDKNWKGPWDSSEFVGWVIYQATGLLVGCRPDDPAHTDCYSGLWAEPGPHTQKISVEEAANDVGSILVRLPTDAKGIGHLAISVGDGTTIEALNSTTGVVQSTAHGRRWNFGVRILAAS